MRRGDVIWLKNPAPELKRPLVVVSNDIACERSSSILVVPLTRKMKRMDLPTHALVSEGRSVAMCENIYIVEKEDVLRTQETLSSWDMERISQCLREAMDLD